VCQVSHIVQGVMVPANKGLNVKISPNRVDRETA
jgi:hypothetical protein